MTEPGAVRGKGNDVDHPNASWGSASLPASVHAPSNSVATTASLPPPVGPDHPPCTGANAVAGTGVSCWIKAGSAEATTRCVPASACRTPAGGRTSALLQISSPAAGTAPRSA